MNALYDYYPEASISAAGYRLVQFEYAGRLVRKPAITPVTGRRLRIPLLDGREDITDTAAPAAPVFDPELQAIYTARLRATGARLWDADLYCVTSFSAADGRLHAGIASGRFLSYRLSVGLLREELAHARETGDWSLPLRRQIAPDVAAFTDFTRRLTGGGVHTFCAFRRPAPDDDYVILLQRRSGSVSEARGTYGVVPMAFHQPPRYACPPLDPRSPAATSLREVYEEIFGGDEDSDFLAHPAIQWLLHNRVSIHFELTSFYVSLIGGNYEFGVAMIVPDPDYWRRFGSLLQHGWESEQHLLVSSLDEPLIRELLCSDNWEGQALGTCVEGLMRLGEIDPPRAGHPLMLLA
ncbi:MAG: hypothetical protein HY820_42470 [Acidobacteria bacterium]|nr:hypothetical protein [Acidobacteriota bacterium]